jgi:rhodanese-related sulfurtransferase
MVQTIEIKELQSKLSLGSTVLIDVRSPAEFRSVHIPGAELHPLDSLNPAELIKKYPDVPIHLVCQGGTRSAKAAALFEESGAKLVFSVAGGTKAWQQAGFAVDKGSSVISLERQVRIAAGLLVIIGVFLGFSLGPIFFGLSAFVGAGLVFAGITDTCGMALMLARMPWNR